MAIFHFTVTQTKRSKGQSAIASAAYRSGERLYSEYYGEYSDYTRKGGVICSDILLPSHAPPGQSLAFSLGDEKGFEWIGAYDITADELLAGTDTAKTESKTAQAQMLILELLADGKRMPSAELEKTVNERGISSRTMSTAKRCIGDRLVTEKDGTAWVCYLRD